MGPGVVSVEVMFLATLMWHRPACVEHKHARIIQGRCKGVVHTGACKAPSAPKLPLQPVLCITPGSTYAATPACSWHHTRQVFATPTLHPQSELQPCNHARTSMQAHPCKRVRPPTDMQPMAASASMMLVELGRSRPLGPLKEPQTCERVSMERDVRFFVCFLAGASSGSRPSAASRLNNKKASTQQQPTGSGGCVRACVRCWPAHAHARQCNRTLKTVHTTHQAGRSDQGSWAAGGAVAQARVHEVLGGVGGDVDRLKHL